MKTKLYGCYSIDSSIREKSSSGGLFYVLASTILNDKGIVFGARFNNHWEVVHDKCDKVEDLVKYMGSKYVQSKIGNSFKVAEACLKAGKKVLFSGTPCQIAGLKSYLGSEYDQLFTVDFVCHGVPSRIAWKKYLNELSNYNIENISNITFRNKKLGWYKYSPEIILKSKKKITDVYYENIFMKGFLKDLYLRPSCYNCAFKGIERGSDITLADYWGVDIDYPELYDDLGTSLILVHSNKGEKIIEKVKSKLVLKETTMSALQYNSAAINSVVLPENRKIFFERFNKEDFISLVDNLTKENYSVRIFRFIKKAGKRLLKRN